MYGHIYICVFMYIYNFHHMQEQFAKAAEIIISIILFHNVIQFILLYMLSTKYLYEVIEYELINLHPLRGMDDMLYTIYIIVEILYTTTKPKKAEDVS